MKRFYVAINFLCDQVDQGQATVARIKQCLAEDEATSLIRSCTIRVHEEIEGTYQVPEQLVGTPLDELPIGLSCDDVFVPNHPEP